MERIIGLIDAPFTPMKPNGDINLEPIPAYAAMLAGNGLTTPVLEAALGAALRVRVLRQDDVPAEQIPDGILRDLRLVSGQRALVRRSVPRTGWASRKLPR